MAILFRTHGDQELTTKRGFRGAAEEKKYPAAFKERAVKLAVESEQPIAQTARDLGVNENTLHTWIGKYHRVERQKKRAEEKNPKGARKARGKKKALLKKNGKT